MLVIYFFAIFCLTQTFGQELPTSDEEWQNLNPYLKFINMDLDGREHEDNLLQQTAFAGSTEDSVFYYLYTRENTEGYEIKKNDTVALNESTFDPSRKTKIVIHGFMNNHQSPCEEEITEAYLASQDVNVVTVDWSELSAFPFYHIAVANSLAVGEEVGLFIDFLVTSGGANISDIHLLGHSIGAHVASFAANNVTTGRITRISGLDPALPLYGSRSADGRLDPTDADIVDCIHTCGGDYGFYEPLCTHDFYPNGGIPVQPGCGFDLLRVCSHGRAFELHAASVSYNFTAQACSSFQEVKKKNCTGDWTGLMGELAPTVPTGLYYLDTTDSYPYVET